MSQPLKYAWPAMVIKELEIKRAKEMGERFIKAWHKTEAEDAERKRLNDIWKATKAASGC